MKGRIGFVGRVHYLALVDNEKLTATGSCNKFKGAVILEGPRTKITCPECLGIYRVRRIKPTVTVVIVKEPA
jgi:hypothetical protein